MIGIALAFIVLGILVFFAIPWVGIVVGVVGLILAVLYLAGFGGRAAKGQQPQ